MSPYHTRCEEDCSWRCVRAGCLEPGVHFLVKTTRQGNRWVGLHNYDCVTPVSLAVEVVETLRPGMSPDEIRVARRILLEALDRLEHAQTTRPSIVREESA